MQTRHIYQPLSTHSRPYSWNHYIIFSLNSLGTSILSTLISLCCRCLMFTWAIIMNFTYAPLMRDSGLVVGLCDRLAWCGVLATGQTVCLDKLLGESENRSLHEEKLIVADVELHLDECEGAETGDRDTLLQRNPHSHSIHRYENR